MAGTLVYLETHDGELTKGGLGVLGKAASLGGDVAGVVLGSGVRDVAAKLRNASPRYLDRYG